jgi:hypothetical protein
VIDIIKKTKVRKAKKPGKSSSNVKVQRGTKRAGELGRDVYTKEQLLARSLLSKQAALARIRTPLYSLIDDDIRFKLKSMEGGGDWKRVSSDSDLMEGLKQIVAWLEWPQTMIGESKVSYLTWRMADILSSVGFRGADFQPFFAEGIIDRVEYHPFEKSTQRRTRIFLPFPTPSPYHLRTLTSILGGIDLDKSTNMLMVAAPTFYECWVKAALSALLCSYKISRTQIYEGKDEIFYLQGLGEYYLQAQILRDLLIPIQTYQRTGARYLPPDSNYSQGLEPYLLDVKGGDWKDYVEQAFRSAAAAESETSSESDPRSFSKMQKQKLQEFNRGQELLASLTRSPYEDTH